MLINQTTRQYGGQVHFVQDNYVLGGHRDCAFVEVYEQPPSSRHSRFVIRVWHEQHRQNVITDFVAFRKGSTYSRHTMLPIKSEKMFGARKLKDAHSIFLAQLKFSTSATQRLRHHIKRVPDRFASVYANHN